MKNSVCILVFFIIIRSTIVFGSTVDEQQQPEHPSFATFNDKYYDDKGFKNEYFGKVGALSGKIVQVEKGPQNKLIFELELENSGKTLWVGLLPKTTKDQITPGADISVLGYFDHSEKEPEFIAKVSNSAEYLLGFCLIEKIVGLPVFYTKLLSQCFDWESGQYDFKHL